MLSPHTPRSDEETQSISSIAHLLHSRQGHSRRRIAYGLSPVAAEVSMAAETLEPLVMKSAESLLPEGEEALEALRAFTTDVSGYSFQGNSVFPIYVVAQDRFRFAADTDGVIYHITYRDPGDRGPISYHPIAKFPPVLENRDLIPQTVMQSPGAAMTVAQQEALDTLAPAFDPRSIDALFSDSSFLEEVSLQRADASVSTVEQVSPTFVTDAFDRIHNDVPDTPYYRPLSFDGMTMSIEIHSPHDYSYIYDSWGGSIRVDHPGGTADTVTEFTVNLRGRRTNLVGVHLGAPGQTYSAHFPLLHNAHIQSFESTWAYSADDFDDSNAVDVTSGDSLPDGIEYPQPIFSVATDGNTLDVTFASDRDYSAFDIQTSPLRNGRSVGRVLVEHVGGIVNARLRIPLHQLGVSSGAFPVMMIDPQTGEIPHHTYIHVDRGSVRGVTATAWNPELPVIDVPSLAQEDATFDPMSLELKQISLNDTPEQRFEKLRDNKVLAQRLLSQMDSDDIAEHPELLEASTLRLLGNVDTGLLVEHALQPSVSLLSTEGNALVVQAQTPYDNSMIRLSCGGYFASQELSHEGGSSSLVALLAIEATKPSMVYQVELLNADGKILDQFSVQWDGETHAFTLLNAEDVWTPEKQGEEFARMFSDDPETLSILGHLFTTDIRTAVHSNPALRHALDLMQLPTTSVASTSVEGLQGRKLYSQLPGSSPLRMLSASPDEIARALHPELWPEQGDDAYLQSLVAHMDNRRDASDQMAFHRNALLTNRSILLQQTGSQLGALQHASEHLLNEATQYALRLFKGENEPGIREQWQATYTRIVNADRYLQEASIDLRTGVPDAPTYLHAAIDLLQSQAGMLQRHQDVADPITYQQRVDDMIHAEEVASFAQRNRQYIAEHRDRGTADSTHVQRIARRIEHSLLAGSDPRAAAVVAQSEDIDTLFTRLDSLMASLATPQGNPSQRIEIIRDLDGIVRTELGTQVAGVTSTIDHFFEERSDGQRAQLVRGSGGSWILKSHENAAHSGTLIDGESTHVSILDRTGLVDLYARTTDGALVTMIEKALEIENGKSTGSIDRWYAAVGEEPITVTWTVPIDVPGHYSIDVSDLTQWNLSTAVVQTPSGRVQLDDQFYIDGPGTYAISIEGIEVPDEVGIDDATFSLIYHADSPGIGRRITAAQFHTMFVADHSDQFDESSEFRLEDGEVLTGVSALINHFSPVLHFAEGEQFPLPFSVDHVLAESSGVAAGDAHGELTVSQTPANAEGRIYGSVLQQGDRMAVNYYFFFPMSNWGDHGGYNTHQGDWEGATVFLRQNSEGEWVLEEVGMGQHMRIELQNKVITSGGMSVPWSEIEKSTSHPHLYVGLGGHATYSESGVTQIVAYDEDHQSFTEGMTFDVSYLSRLGAQTGSVAWHAIPATWGVEDLLGLKELGNITGDNSPRGPVYADLGFDPGHRWLKPFEWLQDISR